MASTSAREQPQEVEGLHGQSVFQYAMYQSQPGSRVQRPTGETNKPAARFLGLHGDGTTMTYSLNKAKGAYCAREKHAEGLVEG